MKFALGAASILLLALSPAHSADDGKHLFILSGQSNMAGMKPELSFTPTVTKAFGKDNIIVTKSAYSGASIRSWAKSNHEFPPPTRGRVPKVRGHFYDTMINGVKAAIKDQTLKTVTFVWMQGERDAKMGWGDLYEEALVGLYVQLAKDLGRNPKDMTFAIGRLSDFDMSNKRYPHWTKVRKAQVKVADSSSKFAWIDTDDLNDGKNRRGKDIENDLHYSAEGYKTLGRRFAEACLKPLGK